MTTPGPTTTVSTPGATTTVTAPSSYPIYFVGPGQVTNAAATTCSVPSRLSFAQRFSGKVHETAAVIYINGKVAHRVKGHHISTLSFARPAARKFKLRIVATLSDGDVITWSGSYNGCAISGITIKVHHK